MYTKFGADSSSLFPFSARTDTHTQTHKVTDATDHLTHASDIAGVGDKGGWIH